jgi:hypothetical protein
MHLLIPFAVPLSEPGRQVLRGLAPPKLQSLLSLLTPGDVDSGDEWSLSTPQERALARAFGWTGSDGLLPWAAWSASVDGVRGVRDAADSDERAWGLLTPCHWHLGTEQVSLIDPASLALGEAASRALFDAISSLFTSLGFTMHWGAPQRWYIAHQSLTELPCASLDRVIGRNIDRWLGADPRQRALRRLQGEVQMLLHDHPINEARQGQGLPPVNSVWLSGCGVAQAVAGPVPQVDDRLRAPALADDWAAWAKAWETLDAGPLDPLHQAARRGEAVQLTLCGERSSRTWQSKPRNAWQKFAGRWRSPALAALLEPL